MEKYGTVPKKFTKGWWEYFWDYYKWHVIIGGFALIMIIVTVVQFATRIDYDATVTYIGKAEYPETATDEIGADLSMIVSDANENGKKNALFQVFPTVEPNSNMENPQYVMALETKKTVEIQMGESMVFLTDAAQTQQIYDNGIAIDLFTEANDWLTGDNDVVHATGKAEKYFVKIPDNTFLKKYGFVTGDVYIGVRKLREKEKDNKEEEQAAFIIANYLINGK